MKASSTSIGISAPYSGLLYYALCRGLQTCFRSPRLPILVSVCVVVCGSNTVLPSPFRLCCDCFLVCSFTLLSILSQKMPSVRFVSKYAPVIRFICLSQCTGSRLFAMYWFTFICSPYFFAFVLFLCLPLRPYFLRFVHVYLHCLCFWVDVPSIPGRKKPISLKMMVVMWFAGLRGAIAFALALTSDSNHRPVIVTTTMTIVIFTTLVCGTLTSPLLGRLGLSKDSTYRSVSERAPPSVRRSGGLHGLWRRFDNRYMKPLFGGRLHEEAQRRAEAQSVELLST